MANQNMAKNSTAFQRKPNPHHDILVVDDEPSMCRLNTEVLVNSGYHVDTAEDGAIAWETLQTKNYHLLITDYEMPNMSGIELVKKARAARMALPIIMISGTLQVEQLKEHSWLKINAILPKPYCIADLLKTVKEVLCSAV
jgi:DNA-binding response OmpR family regulator